MGNENISVGPFSDVESIQTNGRIITKAIP
jgi:hypothetical protein